MRRFRWSVAIGLLVAAVASTDAEAAFPGQNGRIAYSLATTSTDGIFTVLPDGSGQTQLTNGPGYDDEPSWSSDGTKITFSSTRDGNSEIYVMNADGSGQVRLTNNPAYDAQPAWSPDGTRIAFESRRDVPASSRRSEVYVMNADGTNQQRITNYPYDDSEPAWSPDGSRIAFSTERAPTGPAAEIWTMRPDGSDLREITHGASCFGGDRWHYTPNWSPDGRKIVYVELTDTCDAGDGFRTAHVVDADGSNPTQITPHGPEQDWTPVWSPDGTRIASSYSGTIMNADGSNRIHTQSFDTNPDWQPLPVNTPSTYPRPKAATPTYLSLVPAYGDCTTPNRQHGGGFSFGSCAPPNHLSPTLTVGVGDGSPAFSRSVGFVRLKALPGAAGAPDDADMAIRLSLTNVMRKSDLSDYTGELGLDLSLQLTDHEGAVSQTTMGFDLSATAPCTPTASTIDGATCDLNTTVKALVPNAITEGLGTILGLGPIKVRDGGPDEDADTPAGDGVLATQGVFVP